MLQSHEYLILSFFDTKIPKEFTDKDLTPEMRWAGIGSTKLDGSHFQYVNIVLRLDQLKLIEVKYSGGKRLTVATKGKYILTPFGKQTIQQIEIEQQKQREEQETQKLIENLQIKNIQLQNENLDLQNSREKLEKANYTLEQRRKESQDKLVRLQQRSRKISYCIQLYHL